MKTIRKQIFDAIVGKIKVSTYSPYGYNYFVYCWHYVDEIINDSDFNGKYYEVSKLDTVNGIPIVIDIEWNFLHKEKMAL